MNCTCKFYLTHFLVKTIKSLDEKETESSKNQGNQAVLYSVKTLSSNHTDKRSLLNGNSNAFGKTGVIKTNESSPFQNLNNRTAVTSKENISSMNSLTICQDWKNTNFETGEKFREEILCDKEKIEIISATYGRSDENVCAKTKHKFNKKWFLHTCGFKVGLLTNFYCTKLCIYLSNGSQPLVDFASQM